MNKYNLIFRELEKDDISYNFLNIINHFTKKVDDIDKTIIFFKENFEKIHNEFFKTYIIILNNCIIGTIKCIIETKFHNNGKKVLHIEDVVIDNNYRNNGIGTFMIHKIINIAKDLDCYKIILCCNMDVSNFYLKNSFIKKGIEMCMYL